MKTVLLCRAIAAAIFHVLLREEDSSVFLLLNGGDVPKGRSLSVVCVAAAGEAELYTMAVSGGAPGALSLSVSGSVPRVRRWVRYPTGGFLFVPDAYLRASGGSVSVTVHVKKLPPPELEEDTTAA
uniref:Uncharacterized protein n=1 Tax=Oryza meridionalis TaxID=40149 RepID=A0A0E0BWA8_9ORYZ